MELGPREDEPSGDCPYREVVGGFLMRLSTMTWSDISNAVRAVVRHSHNPTDRHWKAVTKIMAYLVPSRGQGVRNDIGTGCGIAIDCV